MTRPFTVACLAAIHALRLAGCALSQIAHTTGRSVTDIDRACWALVGRSIPEAVKVLGGAA